MGCAVSNSARESSRKSWAISMSYMMSNNTYPRYAVGLQGESEKLVRILNTAVQDSTFAEHNLDARNAFISIARKLILEGLNAHCKELTVSPYDSYGRCYLSGRPCGYERVYHRIRP